jgi:hypothetical protein
MRPTKEKRAKPLMLWVLKRRGELLRHFTWEKRPHGGDYPDPLEGESLVRCELREVPKKRKAKR